MTDQLDDLERLAKLKENGVITQEEFDDQKAKLLDNDQEKPKISEEPKDEENKEKKKKTSNWKTHPITSIVCIIIIVAVIFGYPTFERRVITNTGQTLSLEEYQREAAQTAREIELANKEFEEEIIVNQLQMQLQPIKQNLVDMATEMLDEWDEYTFDFYETHELATYQKYGEYVQWEHPINSPFKYKLYTATNGLRYLQAMEITDQNGDGDTNDGLAIDSNGQKIDINDGEWYKAYSEGLPATAIKW